MIHVEHDRSNRTIFHPRHQLNACASTCACTRAFFIVQPYSTSGRWPATTTTTTTAQHNKFIRTSHRVGANILCAYKMRTQTKNNNIMKIINLLIVVYQQQQPHAFCTVWFRKKKIRHHTQRANGIVFFLFVLCIFFIILIHMLALTRVGFAHKL